LGIVAKQASKNALIILAATFFGAVNNVFVLPRAFSDAKAEWGFIAFMTAVAIISAQIVSLGAHNVFVNFLPRIKDSINQNILVTKVLIYAGLSTVLFGVFLYLTDTLVVNWLAEEDRLFYLKYKPLIALFTGAMVLFNSMSGYLYAKFETVLVTLLLDPFTKISYLILALLFLLGIIDFEWMLILFVSIYVFIALAALARSIKLGFRLKSGELANAKEVINYAGYSILDKGAVTITQKLDIIMVSMILDFEYGADFILASFIGQVVFIPFKSIQAIANPIVSKEIKSSDHANLSEIYKQTGLYSLVIGGLVFGLIWINIDEILLILPEKFRGGKYVVLFIGLAKLIQMSGSVSSAMIVYSKYYRFILKLNLLLLVLTVVTNITLITRYGINGAAAATALTLLIFTAVKLIYVFTKFDLQPFTKKFFMAALSLVLIVFGGTLIELPVHFLISIGIKSALFSLIFYFLLRLLKVIPKIKSLSNLKGLIS